MKKGQNHLVNPPWNTELLHCILKEIRSIVGACCKKRKWGEEKRAGENRETKAETGEGQKNKKEDLGTHTFLKSLSRISFSHPAAPSHQLIYMLQFILP